MSTLLNLEEALDVNSKLYNMDAEQSILGSILLDSATISEILNKVKLEYFYNQQNKKIFSVLIRMFSSGINIDVITVLNEISKEKIFETEEKAKIYLTSLAQIVPTLNNIKSYAKILEDKYIMRSLFQISKQTADTILNGGENVQDVLDVLEQQIYDIRKGKTINGLVKIDEIIVAAYDRLQKLSSDKQKGFSGASCGFSGIDRALSGLNKSDLILLAARPGMGKTSFALNVATNFVSKNDGSVCIFSLEMSKEQLVSRILCSEARIQSYNFKRGELTTNQWKDLASVSGNLSKSNIYIDDSSNITILEMKSRLRRVKNLGLVVIDYLQLMSTGGRSNGNRVQEISELTRNLKILAKDLDVPVITLSQLSRGPESRINNHRPMLADLRDSGSIEQDADIVMFLYRESYYNKDMEEGRNVCECIIAKNRHGEVNTVKLNWDGEHTKFTSLEVYKDGE